MSRWLILRTSGGQTLPLMTSLRAAGFDAWTPARTIRKVLRPGKRTEQRVEVDIAILPTFVFAREADLVGLVDAAARPVSPHPAFSLMTHAGRIPLVSDRDVAGLREEEARAIATMQAIRDAETHAAAEEIRIAAIQSEAARRRAVKASLLAQREAAGTFELGAEVRVVDLPALAGVTGVVEARDGSYAEVRFGTQAWKIEGWRLALSDVEAESALTGPAA